MKTTRMSVLIWIQTVLHSDGGPGWFIFKTEFLMKKCIDLANSTFNLYVLYIKLAQNTKQELLAIRRIFSPVGMITNTNFLKLP